MDPHERKKLKRLRAMSDSEEDEEEDDEDRLREELGVSECIYLLFLQTIFNLMLANESKLMQNRGCFVVVVVVIAP